MKGFGNSKSSEEGGRKEHLAPRRCRSSMLLMFFLPRNWSVGKIYIYDCHFLQFSGAQNHQALTRKFNCLPLPFPPFTFEDFGF